MGFPILYRQTRPGLNRKPFKIYKFRTMNNERDKYGNLLPYEERLTTIGKVLRSTSLDELAELNYLMC
ncbi:sugar transferase [Thermoanaerobacterium thermosaccharolyticum]|uniref:sugar transferase n=1 Tax=Thermoanaerobacterium thermosaccharolyticum TaxID=1517 RepID=UPI0002FCE69A|nr:sugar transferase [Thermoanaerobacterium thermosaccharolyticum]